MIRRNFPRKFHIRTVAKLSMTRYLSAIRIASLSRRQSCIISTQFHDKMRIPDVDFVAIKSQSIAKLKSHIAYIITTPHLDGYFAISPRSKTNALISSVRRYRQAPFNAQYSAGNIASRTANPISTHFCQ